MRYRSVLALSLGLLSIGAYASSACQEKEQDIQREIHYAEKHHNQSRIDGLNAALREVRTNCSNSKLHADHQKKIARQKEEVAARRHELEQVKAKGDTGKIEKQTRKLEKARNQLKALESSND